MSYDNSGKRGEGLRDHLAKLAVKSSFDEKKFFPHGCIDTAITAEAVFQELGNDTGRLSVEARQAQWKDLDGLVEFIMMFGKKVFAISICCGLEGQQIVEAMTQFRHVGFRDSELPVMFEHNASPPSMLYSSAEKAYRKPWNHLLAHTFCSEVQWMFLAPKFSEFEPQLSLHINAILPFIGAVTPGATGAFGVVHEVTIHPAHRKNIRTQVRTHMRSKSKLKTNAILPRS